MKWYEKNEVAILLFVSLVALLLWLNVFLIYFLYQRFSIVSPVPQKERIYSEAIFI